VLTHTGNLKGKKKKKRSGVHRNNFLNSDGKNAKRWRGTRGEKENAKKRPKRGGKCKKGRRRGVAPEERERRWVKVAKELNTSPKPVETIKKKKVGNARAPFKTSS